MMLSLMVCKMIWVRWLKKTVKSRGHDIKCRVFSGLTRPREYVNSAEPVRNNKEHNANQTLFQVTHHLI